MSVLKVTWPHGPDDRSVKGSEIPIGTVFHGQISDYKDRLFLKAGENLIVSLDHLKNRWSMGPEVKRFAPVDIEITVVGYK